MDIVEFPNDRTVISTENNGFAGGLVAMFLVPVIHSIRDRKARAKGELSL